VVLSSETLVRIRAVEERAFEGLGALMSDLVTTKILGI